MSQTAIRREQERTSEKSQSRFHFSKGKRGTVRDRYLDHLEQDVNQRLKASIHAARFLEIGVNEKLNATVPWHYKVLEGEQQFTNFDLAFEHFQGRVLLLGPPGSGKTTTLLNLTLKLIADARRDQSADIPLFFNLSEFGAVSERRVSQQLAWIRQREDPVEDNPERVFENWLVQMLVKIPGVEGLNRQVAQQWVNSGRVAALLDGLDEVTDTYLIKLGEILNQTYFREHPAQTVVVCSRLIDYQPLQDDKEARLRLNGAVVLQPPTPQQIDEYLEAAQALSLRDALRGDNALYEMAQTPLTLSMMTLAYGGEAPTNIPQDLPFLERRRNLLDTYVERMVQRTARREKGIPFDLDPEKDVPPKYPLKRTNHYLGWLAIKLSERMRTQFPLGQFYSFLAKDYPADEVSDLAIKYGVPLLAVWVIAVAMNGGLLAKNRPWWLLVAVPVLAVLAGSLRAVEEVTRANRYWRNWVDTVLPILTVVYFLFCFALLNQSIVSVLGYKIHPVITTPIVVATLILCFLIYDSFIDKTRSAERSSQPTLILTGPLLLLAAIALFLGQDFNLIVYAMSGGSCLVTFIEMRRAFADVKLLVFVPGFTLAGIALIAVTAGIGWLISLQLLLGLSLSVTILLGLASVNESWRGTPITLAIVTVLANWLGGPAVAVLAIAVVCLFYMVTATRGVSQLFERVVLNPVLKLALSISRNTCFRYGTFLHYASDTMLLKQSGTDYEFVHRLLRDHFAIRELIPQLFQAEGEQRIGIIKRLSRQGDSSFDALANLATNSDPRVRGAAIEGLGRIAIPKVFPIMRDSVRNDPDEEVRASVVRSLGKFESIERAPILKLAIRDYSPQVRRTVIRAATDDNDLLLLGLQDEADIVFRQTLTEIRKGFFHLLPGTSLDAKIIDRLAKAVLEPDKYVSGGAARTLRELYRSYEEGEQLGARLQLVSKIVPALLAKATDNDPEVRIDMLQTLSAVANEDIAPDQKGQIHLVLTHVLRDNDATVRRAAIRGLAALKYPESVRTLRELLSQNGAHPRETITALGSVRDRESLPLIMKYFNNPLLRYHAAKAVADIADPSVIPQLLDLLDDSDLQISAIMALAELKVKSAVPKIAELFVRPPKTKKRYLGIIRRRRDVRPYAAIALGKIGDIDSVPTLLRFSPSLSAKLLFSQVSALKRLIPHDVHNVLVEALANLTLKEQEALHQKLYNANPRLRKLSSDSQTLPNLVADLLTSKWNGPSVTSDDNDWQFFFDSDQTIVHSFIS